MRVTGLKVTNLRVIDAAEFRFQPGFNLIVGVNGVGKTSVLDALAVALSAVVKQSNRLFGQPQSFALEDIRVGAAALTVECTMQIGVSNHTYLIHKPRERNVPRKGGAGMPREQVRETPQRTEFVGDTPTPATGKESGGRPLAALFSTSRAVASERAPAKGVAAGGIAGAYAGALAIRELRLGEFAAWMRVQETLSKEKPDARRVLSAFEHVVRRFLPGYSNFRVSSGKPPKLLIDRAKKTLAVRQLSDGERGMLALVLDLTRRLAQANPALDLPAARAEAVVLIDEIDLHLHPKWQRDIIRNLTAAFPACQFIATTHSPQVIGEVDHSRIQIIADGQVYSPTHSFGVDSSRVLEEIMQAGPRTKKVQDLLSKLSRAIGDAEYDQARDLLGEVSAQIGDDDPEVTRARTLLEFMKDEK
jgi:predicted ATP-binding protein involved in virulence